MKSILVSFCFAGFGGWCFAADTLQNIQSQLQSRIEIIDKKLDILKSGISGDAIVFSEDEINAYLQVNGNRISKSTAKDMKIVLSDHHFRITALVDLAKLNLATGSIWSNLIVGWLTGEHRLDAQVYFHAERNTGIYRVLSFQVDGLTVPPFIIGLIATKIGQTQTPQKLPNQPFPMPYNLDSVKVSPKQILCLTKK